MDKLVKNPYSPEEQEMRLQTLLAQRTRARQLFHCYAQDCDDEDEDDVTDIYYLYYAAGR